MRQVRPLALWLSLSGLLLAAAVSASTPSASRPSPYPDYYVGDTGTLLVTTDPPQPHATVYMFRTKNGQPDGPQPTVIGSTDALGRYEIRAELESVNLGSYSNERFAVGSPTGTKSWPPLAFTISPPLQRPSVTRSAPYPDYRVGDVASLLVTTSPRQPYATVYQFRTKNGLPDGPQPTAVGTTDANGRFEISAELESSNLGTYSGERYAVGSATGLRSSPALSFTVSPALQAPSVSRPAPYPDYVVGDTSTLVVATDPPQPNATVYQFRKKDGLPDGPQPSAVGTTNSQGVYQISATLTDGNVGSYSEERYAVGSPGGLRSSPSLSFSVAPEPMPNGPPIVARPAPYPNYTIGDTAILSLSTEPIQPGQAVYQYRLMDGLPDGPQPTVVGFTDSLGRFHLEAELDPGTEGTYSEERYAVGDPDGPRSAPLTFSIHPADPQIQAPVVHRPPPFPTYQVGDPASLHIETEPVQAGQPIFRYRMKDGAPDGAQPTLVGVTDAAGRFSVNVESLPAEAAGSYTDEQFTVGDPEGLRSDPLAFTIADSEGELEFTGLEPQVIDSGETTLVTFFGENFSSRTAVRWFSEGSSPDTDDGTGVADPDATGGGTALRLTLLSVAPDGTSMTVEVDATDFDAADSFELVGVSEGKTEKAQPIRVQGPGPVVDAWTPSVPNQGDTYVFTLLGNHLRTAQLSPPSGVSIQVTGRAEQRITGLLHVDPHADTGAVELEVRGAGRSVHVPMLIRGATASKASSTKNLLAGSDIENQAKAAGSPLPELWMQDIELNPRVTSARNLATSRTASQAGSCFSFITSWVATYPLYQELLTFDFETGEIGPIAGALGVGEALEVGAFTLSIRLDVALHIQWFYCPDLGFLPVAACIEALLQAEVPGGSWTYTYRSCNSISGDSGDSEGRTDQAAFTGGACAAADTGKVEEGIVSGTIRQTACCDQTIGLQMSGVSFGQPFDLESVNVGRVESECPVEEQTVEILYTIMIPADHVRLPVSLLELPIFIDPDVAYGGDGVPKWQPGESFRAQHRVEILLAADGSGGVTTQQAVPGIARSYLPPDGFTEGVCLRNDCDDPSNCHYFTGDSLVYLGQCVQGTPWSSAEATNMESMVATELEVAPSYVKLRLEGKPLNPLSAELNIFGTDGPAVDWVAELEITRTPSGLLTVQGLGRHDGFPRHSIHVGGVEVFDSGDPFENGDTPLALGVNLDRSWKIDAIIQPRE